MKIYDLYGIKDYTLEEAKSAIEKALGITFIPHESFYYGGDYYLWRGAEHESLILKNNFDLLEKECFEENFPECGVLLDINGTLRADEIKSDRSRSLRRLNLLSMPPTIASSFLASDMISQAISPLIRLFQPMLSSMMLKTA